MKKVLALMFASLALLGMVACKVNHTAPIAEPSSRSESIVSSAPEIDEATTEKVVNALFSGGWLGTTCAASEFENEALKDDLALTTFFCMMNPGYVYPSEIPASKYEPFIQGYFDISTDFLHGIEDYNVATDAYKVSVDISADMLRKQATDYFRIDSIEQENGLIKVSYRILFGAMAGSGDGSDSAFEGYVLLKENSDFFHVNSVIVTKDDSKKYEG